jgi:hypothetical protein
MAARSVAIGDPSPGSEGDLSRDWTDARRPEVTGQGDFDDQK